MEICRITSPAYMLNGVCVGCENIADIPPFRSVGTKIVNNCNYDLLFSERIVYYLIYRLNKIEVLSKINVLNDSIVIFLMNL